MKQLRNIALICLGGILLAVTIIHFTDAQSMSSPVVQQSNFDYAIKIVMQHEGGLTNSPNDPGGITAYGLSLRYLRTEHLDVNGDGIVSKDDVIDLTKSEAESIYYRQWWEKYYYNRIKDKLVCTKIFDFAINAGESQSVKLVQRAINRIEHNKIPVTGIMDDSTINLINKIEPPVMLDTLKAEEADFYRAIVKKNKKLSVFLSGWLRRAAS